jgi:hypothetical protein
MLDQSLHHAIRFPSTVQSHRITVLDNGKVDRDWFNDRRPEPPPIAGPVVRPNSALAKSPQCHPTGNPSRHEVGCWFSPGRDPIVSRHSDGIPYPVPGPRPQGDRALTSAERMRRLREKRKAEAVDKPPEKPPVVIRYRRPKDRRSRPDQWADAINTSRTASSDIRSGATTWPLVLPTARSPNASTLRWNCATSLTSYRLPSCRADSDGTENRTMMFHTRCLVAVEPTHPLILESRHAWSISTATSWM